MDAAYDIPKLSQYLDYVSVMTYDYHGQWDKQTGHVAPMYQHQLDKNVYFNVVSFEYHTYTQFCGSRHDFFQIRVKLIKT
jgi:GH18 family chitinase